MTDLILPIIIVVVMFILIDYFDTWIPLMVTGFLFLPISWLFTYQLRDGLYTEMFGADISPYLTDIPGLETILSITMFVIPIVSFFKMYWVSRMIKTPNTD
jgi:hypothetical protein